MTTKLETYIDLISQFLEVKVMKEVVLINKYICKKIQPELYSRGSVPWKYRSHKFCGIVFEEGFDETIDLTEFPHLKYLKFNKEFNHPLDLSYQTELESLIFTGGKYGKFNHVLNLSAQIKLKRLTISSAFKQNLDLSINTQLQKLCMLGGSKIPDLRHNTKLQILIILFEFNHPLDLSANTQLKRFDLAGGSNYPLDLSANTQLRILNIWNFPDQPVYLPIDSQIKKLIYKNFNPSQLINLSAQTGLKSLYINYYPAELPSMVNLEQLSINTRHIQELNLSANKKLKTVDCFTCFCRHTITMCE